MFSLCLLTGALTYISRKLQQDLPGLHGFSETNLKMMRIFYEQWAYLDSTKSSATADDFNAPQSGLEIISTTGLHCRTISTRVSYLPVRRVRRFIVLPSGVIVSGGKSIGILLCKSVDKTYAEYMVRSYENPMGVATFRTADDMPEKLRKALPDIEALKKLL